MGKEGAKMKKRFGLKVFVYVLCVSFLVMMSGFSGFVVEAKEKGLPLGGMVSKGDVKFEARENVWKGVEPSQFPLFQGTKIKTEKGVAVVTLTNDSQIEVSPDSLFSLDQDGRFILSQGNIEFRIPSASEINFKAGNLSILKSRTLQAAKDLSTPARNEEAIGSISMHTNGSVTVKSVQGKLTVMNQDQVVLAALSSKDSVTIPSTTVGAKPPVMVAQVGEVGAGGGPIFGMSIGTVVLVGAGVAAGVGVVWGIHETTEKDHEEAPVCP
jgi:hypothetical protein